MGTVLVIVASSTLKSTVIELVGTSVVVGVLILGLLVIGVSVVGCIGARTRNGLLLVIYAGLLSGIFVAEVALGVWVIMQEDAAETFLGRRWESSSNSARVDMQDR